MRQSDIRRIVSRLWLCGIMASGAVAASPETLTIGTWGGPYEAAQQAALFKPFEAQTGIRIDTVPYFGGLEALGNTRPTSTEAVTEASTASGVVDVLDMLESDTLLACDRELLQPLDVARLVDGSDTDFIDEAMSACGVAHLTYSTLIAFDERAFNDQKPRHIADFFDVERFPGKRALQRDPASVFEWAMMAEGVPIAQVYDLLSTERGMRLVSKRLDALREHILWWDEPGQAIDWLGNGDVVMASGYNGRFFDARQRGVPLNMIWDGQIVDRSVWAINRHTANRDAALAFLRFATAAERQAAVAERIPYGPTRLSALAYIGSHPVDGINMGNHLPTARHHLDNALFRDTRWYARTHRYRRQAFQQWLDDEPQH